MRHGIILGVFINVLLLSLAESKSLETEDSHEADVYVQVSTDPYFVAVTEYRLGEEGFNETAALQARFSAYIAQFEPSVDSEMEVGTVGDTNVAQGLQVDALSRGFLLTLKVSGETLSAEIRLQCVYSQMRNDELIPRSPEELSHSAHGQCYSWEQRRTQSIFFHLAGSSSFSHSLKPFKLALTFHDYEPSNSSTPKSVRLLGYSSFEGGAPIDLARQPKNSLWEVKFPEREAKTIVLINEMCVENNKNAEPISSEVGCVYP